MTPAERDRLVGWVPHMIRWAPTDKARSFLIGVQAREKRRAGRALTAGEASWLRDLVARFQADTFADDVIEPVTKRDLDTPAAQETRR